MECRRTARRSRYSCLDGIPKAVEVSVTEISNDTGSHPIENQMLDVSSSEATLFFHILPRLLCRRPVRFSAIKRVLFYKRRSHYNALKRSQCHILDDSYCQSVGFLLIAAENVSEM